MKILDRIFILVLALIMAILSVGIFGFYFELLSQYQIADFISGLGGRIDVLVVSIVLFLLAARIIQLSFTTKKGKEQTIIGEGELGTIRITLEAINKFVKDLAAEEAKATNIKSEIKVRDAGLDIILNLAVYKKTKVPNLANKLQQHVKAGIEDSIGAQVNQVEVLVEAIEKSEEKNRNLRLD
ncbi:MAG: alkaline shock response membrane anchor protein AmaP [Bacillota bacterium]